MKCDNCATISPDSAKFCAECGRALTARAITPAKREPAEERKTLTVLFADLKGSTALLEGRDPEEARALIDPAVRVMIDAVQRYEGFVAQTLGDGIFALFGAPIAFEDHARRAVHAALAMQAAMRERAASLAGTPEATLAIRVGINTGEVLLRSVTKDAEHSDYVPVGHCTHLAARMEQLAAPGSILITEYTQRYCEGFFDCQALGATDIKGVTTALQIFEVRGELSAPSRFHATAQRGLSRFAGRAAELASLERAYHQALEEHGQAVTLIGEPGIGKSRVLHEFKARIGSDNLLLEAQGIAHARQTRYLPMTALLQALFGIRDADDTATRQVKIKRRWPHDFLDANNRLPFIYALLNIAEDSNTLGQLGAAERRRRLHEAMCDLFLALARERPTVCFFEDLHWFDVDSIALLEQLTTRMTESALFLLFTARPEFSSPWVAHSSVHTLQLPSLDAESSV